MRGRTLELARAQLPDDEIANVLTEEGHRSPTCTDRVLPNTVQKLRFEAGIKTAKQRTRWRHEGLKLSSLDLAAKLNIPVNWILVQIRKKRILIEPQPSGAYLFEDTPSVLQAVRELRDHIVDSIDLRICQPNAKGH